MRSKVRELADAERIRRLIEALGRIAPTGTRVYLVGGATAVLNGWRESTVDVNLRIEPESDEVMMRIGELKERLQANIEFATPADFMPELPGWRDRSAFRLRSGSVEVFDYDLYSQALAKIERGFDSDLSDVESMISDGLVDKAELRRLFGEIEHELFRFPAIDPDAFREKLSRALA